MIFCYSVTQNSKFCADILGKILNQPVYILNSDLDPNNKIAFSFSCIRKALTKKSSPILNMPTSDKFDNSEIYICAPIWAGQPAAPIRYFFENAPLEGKKVHMLLTAGVSHMKYINTGIKMISDAGGIPGTVEVFAIDSKAGTEQNNQDVIESHIQELFFN
ncbi:MAG: hypothetical protein FWC91_01125 [Defluviitaleaceae bacterium]|nr:hypothetical protein [Defluviitaleaceae bacterium]